MLNFLQINYQKTKISYNRYQNFILIKQWYLQHKLHLVLILLLYQPNIPLLPNDEWLRKLLCSIYFFLNLVITSIYLVCFLHQLKTWVHPKTNTQDHQTEKWPNLIFSYILHLKNSPSYISITTVSKYQRFNEFFYQCLLNF